MLPLLLTSSKTSRGVAPNPYHNVYVAFTFCTSCLAAHFTIFVTVCIVIFWVLVLVSVSLGLLPRVGCPSPPVLWDHTGASLAPSGFPPLGSRVPRAPLLWVVCAVLLAGSTPTHRLSAVRLWAVLCFALRCLALSGFGVGQPSVVKGK